MALVHWLKQIQSLTAQGGGNAEDGRPQGLDAIRGEIDSMGASVAR